MMNKKTLLSITLAIFVFLSPLSAVFSSAGSYGESIYDQEVIIGNTAKLANGTFWNSSLSDRISENYITSIPNTGVTPVIGYGNDIYGAPSFKTASAVAEKERSGRVLAGINGDFFTMATGVPAGIVIKNHQVLSSGTTNSVGFYDDGRAVIGSAGLNISLSSPALPGEIKSLNMNKVLAKNNGIVLYTTHFSSDKTNRAKIPSYNVLVRINSGDMRPGGSMEGTVISYRETDLNTAVDNGTFLLSMATETPYTNTLNQLKSLQAGTNIKISFNCNEAWKNIAYGIGAGDMLVKDGYNVAPTSGSLQTALHPRTAFGIKKDGSIILYTVDGRNPGHSRGVSLKSLAYRMIELDCVTAVNLDGGGSTVTHGIYPGDGFMSVINKPSESSLRNCSNFIMLMNSNANAGAVSNLHLYPYKVRLLQGASVSFSIKATDVNYNKANIVNNNFSYTTVGEIGTVDSSGKFTAGDKAATGKVVVTDPNGATGSSDIEVIDKPDGVSIVRQSDSKAITSLELGFNETIDLKALAIYKRMPLICEDANFNWAISSDIAAVNEQGVVKASKNKPGNATLTISAGGFTKSIPVAVKGIVEVKPPQITITIYEGIMRAMVVDPDDTFIDQSRIKVTYDGNIIPFTLNGQEVTAQLPDPDGKSHRVTVTARNLSGGIGRSSAKIQVDTPSPFIDMNGHWAENSAKYLYDLGIIKGFASQKGTEYLPNNSLTRAELAVIMAAFMKFDTAQNADVKLPYADLGNIPDWALNAVKTMYKEGIIVGVKDKNSIYYYPRKPITRQEIMTIIGRTMETGYQQNNLAAFEDAGDVSSWALPYVKVLVQLQIVKGYDGKIWPKNNVSRAQAAVIIDNMN